MKSMKKGPNNNEAITDQLAIPAALLGLSVLLACAAVAAVCWLIWDACHDTDGE